jgi:S-formylglutathione hydrolase FrmB
MNWLWRLALCVLVVLDATGVARGQDSAPVPKDASPAAAVAPQAASFRVEFSREVLKAPYTGRLYIALSPRAREPRLDMGDWFGGPQVISMDVSGVKPGELVDISSTSPARTFKAATYADLPKGTYFAQAIARVDPDHCHPGMGEGDLRSEVVKVDFDAKGSGGILTLTLSKGVKREVLGEVDSVKLVEVRSELLSRFHGRDVMMRAGVFLPPDWTPDAKAPYPVVYFITGFGGDHTFVRDVPSIIGRGQSKGVVFVVPDPTCHTGHSVFADSANNGPWGEALLKELIPAVEARFQAGGSGSRRYVTGVSSGGWSSLWLQVAYPDDFNGCWSHCPDPVDFRDFQQIDLYGPGTNMFRDAKGQRRPIGRNPTGSPMLYYDDFVRQESVMGPGGQVGSFEAVFSPRGEDGNPQPLFDRETGLIDAGVAKQWEKYDIRLKVEREWATLGPKLKGKIHVYAGEKDSFYLDGAARLLKGSLAGLGSDAEVQIIPGMIHTIYRKGVQDMMRIVRGGEAPPAK